ncbi:Lrp/AsnC family transcriptional regulator [Methylobacterium oxalidis]|uniref:AsnC family transcriptional regulator n=1 Tax=Methylobacterium oxalidis TaxID=944322 RepID=A0A512IZ94_9HYPH|nr:Lrp/AsnC family transcriptional regulator [Methylobacterium oxalidis]GEP03027.1 AsnC family transcriptional regulator [Methylobacterium oxalidis]GJE31695.1 Leucine-responsive regulatory protein [Methylobacterium oxalidis]GLS65960.1 AsnC family transcriptional regulator [Methylobacterium oxalidis]
MASLRNIPPRALDAFDLAILRIVQKDNKTPQRVIAEAVNLSPAAVQRRITALERSGVIARNVAVVEPEALSLAITALVEVSLRDERAATVDAAKALFRATPEVQQCYYVTGGISFVMVIICRDMRSYEALTRRLFAENDLVAYYRTNVALDRVKADTALVVD